MLCLLSIFFSCQQDKKMTHLKTVSFNIENDVYIEGYSDADDPFLYFASSNNKVYKYYINSNFRDSIDLQEQTKIKNFNRYFVIFNKEEYVVNQSEMIYNSKTNKLYKLDSLSNYNKVLRYLIADNNVSSWSNNYFLIEHSFYCGLDQNTYTDKKKRQIACQEIREKQPS